MLEEIGYYSNREGCPYKGPHFLIYFPNPLGLSSFTWLIFFFFLLPWVLVAVGGDLSLLSMESSSLSRNQTQPPCIRSTVLATGPPGKSHHLTSLEAGIHCGLHHVFVFVFFKQTNDTLAGGECQELKLTQNISQEFTETFPYLPWSKSSDLSPQVIIYSLPPTPNAGLPWWRRTGLRGYWEQF